MLYFKDEKQGQAIVEVLKDHGYEDVRYVRYGDISDDFHIGDRPHRYVHLSFGKQQGFYMSITGAWIEGDAMKLVEQEARKVVEICEEINGILNPEGKEGVEK